MFLLLKEKFLNSQFEVGDCVAGIELNPKKLIGKIVILQDVNEESFLCRLIKVEDNIAEVFFNTKRSAKKIEFKKIAKVLWHRKQI